MGPSDHIFQIGQYYVHYEDVEPTSLSSLAEDKITINSDEKKVKVAAHELFHVLYLNLKANRGWFASFVNKITFGWVDRRDMHKAEMCIEIL